MKENKEIDLELEIIKHLQKSEEDIENGRTISVNQVFEELYDEIDIPRKPVTSDTETFSCENEDNR